MRDTPDLPGTCALPAKLPEFYHCRAFADVRQITLMTIAERLGRCAAGEPRTNEAGNVTALSFWGGCNV